MPVFAQITEYNDVQPKQSQSICNTYLKFAMSSLTVVRGLFLRYLFKWSKENLLAIPIHTQHPLDLYRWLIPQTL